MFWKQYGEGRFEHLNKEFWDAHDSDGVSAHVLRLGDMWCAYANAPSRFGDPMVRHGASTYFVFESRQDAMTEAERLAAAARVSLENERPREHAPIPEGA